MRGLFGVLGSSEEGTNLHWLMLWSSGEIWKARKEIGSTQPRWSKKLGGLRYTGRLGLEGLLLFMYPNYIF